MDTNPLTTIRVSARNSIALYRREFYAMRADIIAGLNGPVRQIPLRDERGELFPAQVGLCGNRPTLHADNLAGARFFPELSETVCHI